MSESTHHKKAEVMKTTTEKERRDVQGDKIRHESHVLNNKDEERPRKDEERKANILKVVLADEALELKCASRWAQCMMNPFQRAPLPLGDIPYPTNVFTLYGRNISTTAATSDSQVFVHTPFAYDVAAASSLVINLQTFLAGVSVTAGYLPYANVGALAGSNIGSMRTIGRGVRVSINYPETTNPPRVFSGTVPASGTPGNVQNYLHALPYTYFANNPNLKLCPQTVSGNCVGEAVWYPDDSQATFLSDDFLNSAAVGYIDDNHGESYPMLVCTGLLAGMSIEIEYIQHVESVPDLANVNVTPVIYGKAMTVCDIDAMFSKMLNILQPLAEKAATAAVGPMGGGLVSVAGSVIRGLMGAKSLQRVKAKHRKKGSPSATYHVDVIDRPLTTSEEPPSPAYEMITIPTRPQPTKKPGQKLP